MLEVLWMTSSYPRHDKDHTVPWMREAVRRIHARGHRVTVLAPSYAGLESHEIDGVEVRRFRYAPRSLEVLTHDEGAPAKVRSPLMRALALPYVAAGCRAARRLATERPFDVIHVHWPFPHGKWAEAARDASGAPIVATCHGAELALARKNSWIKSSLARSLKDADELLANSTHTQSEIARISGCDATVIPFGATVEVAPPPSTSNEPPVILFTGRLIQRKGVEYLLRAMTKVLAHRPARLLITGDGDEKGRLIQLRNRLGLANHVQFLGTVGKGELASLYASCDVNVLPAIHDDNGDTEGLGVTLIEAFMNARPVVASGVGGIVDVVRHEETGLLVPEKDPDKLGDAILWMLENPREARVLAEAAREFACEYFDWERIVDCTIDAYGRATGAVHKEAA